MKNIKCYKCGAILAVPDSTQETTCTACGARLHLSGIEKGVGPLRPRPHPFRHPHPFRLRRP